MHFVQEISAILESPKAKLIYRDAMAGQSPTVAEDESHYCCDCVSSKCGADMTQFIFKFVNRAEPFGQEVDVMKTEALEPKTTVKFYIEERDCEEGEMSDEGVIGEPLAGLATNSILFCFLFVKNN